jgi:hypothetical protein
MRQDTPKLMGYEIVLTDEGFVQDSTEDIGWAIFLLFWDLKYYTLATRTGLTIEKWYYGDNRKNGIVSIKSNSRYGWDVTFWEALTILENWASS